jgi:hypothetical protein
MAVLFLPEAASTMNLARFTLVVLAGVLLAGPSNARAQDAASLPTVVEGLTVDGQTGQPFPNVQVRFDTGERVTSDDQGRYLVEGIAPGLHRVAIVTARCRVTFAELELVAGEIKRVAFAVPSEMVGLGPSHEELKRRSEGDYYSGEELEAMNVRDMLDALRHVAPEMVGRAGGLPGSNAPLQGRTRTAQGAAVPVVVFDGVQVGDGVRSLRDYSPRDIASLEVLRGASRGWEYGTGGAGGVIKVRTRQGSPGPGLSHPDRCEIGDWLAGAPATGV